MYDRVSVVVYMYDIVSLCCIHVYIKAKMIGCIASIGVWMASNRLMLNPYKSEFMWCASPRRVHLIDRSPFVLPDGPVSTSSSIRNLGAYFDESMSMVEHVNDWFVHASTNCVESDSSDAP